MNNNYQYCLTQLLKDEGGYTDHPDDKGGPTNYGITIADYRMYVKQNATAQDVKNMTLDQAKAIYKSKYWDKVDGDNLPSGVDYCVFDYGVNSGVSRAKKVYNQFKEIDIPGGLKQNRDSVDLINKICDERLRFMHNIRGGHDWGVFGKGWQRRVDGVRANSVKLTKGAPPKSIPTGSGTATIAGGAVVATTVVPHTYWQMFLDHWVLYSLGMVATAIAIDILIHLIKNRKTSNVKAV